MNRIIQTGFVLVAFFLAPLFAGAPTAHAAEKLMATGDSQNLWIICPTDDGKGFTIQHRRVKDQPEGKVTPVPAIRGTLINGGAVTGDGNLWLIYTDGSVQSIRVFEDGIGRRGYTDLILPSLPRGITVRSIALTRSGAWVLARIEDQRLLDEIDQPAAQERSMRERRLDRKKPATDAKPAAGPQSTAAPVATTTPATDVPVAKTNDKADAETAPIETPTPAVKPVTQIKADRLLHLTTKRWESVPLPAGWDIEAPSWLITQNYEDDRPMLVTTAPAEKLIRWHTWDTSHAPSQPGKTDAPPVEPAWNTHQQTLPSAPNATPTIIDKQLVVAQRQNTPGKIEVAVTIVRPERISEIGSLSLPDRGGPWALTPVGDQLALITSDKEGALQLLRMNLRGASEEQPVVLASEPPSLGPVADLVMFVLVLALVTPVLILMWKRDPAGQPAKLPKGVRIGELAARLMAAMIDLLPCLYVSSLIYGVEFDAMLESLFNFLPGRHGGWERMIPVAVAIGMYVGHTFLTELFTARTLGKLMLGLRVTGLEGQPPDVWQVLSRNVFKALDLVAMPLLIFAIMSPIRQRLGDVVGRTVVVANQPPDPNERNDAKATDEKDDDEKDDPPDHRPKRPK